MAPHNSSQFLYQDCLIADLSIDTQLQLKNISKYVFRPLGFILAFSSFVLNTLVIIAVARTKSLQYPAMVMICSLAVTDAILPLNFMQKNIEALAFERRTCPNVHLDLFKLPQVLFASKQRSVTWQLSVEIAIWQCEVLGGIAIT